MIRPSRLLALAAVLLLAGTAGYVLHWLGGPVEWTDEWIAPPAFGDAIDDLSSGRIDDGERRLESLFAQYSSPAWRRRAELAVGISRLRRREYQPAHKAFASAEIGGGPLARFAAIKRSEALIGSGRYPQAIELLDRMHGAPTGSAWWDDIALLRAQALAASGKRVEALRMVEEHPSSPRCHDRARVMEAAAKLAEDAGDPSSAIVWYRRIYLEEPRSTEEGRAAARLREVVPASLRFRSTDLGGVASRCRALIAAGDGKSALATWDLFLTSVPLESLDPSRRLDVAEAAIEARQSTRALALLGKLPIARGESRRGLLYARALFGKDRENEAIRVLRIAAEGTGEDAAAARFLLATALDQAEQDREALGQFLRYVRETRDGERVNAALWRAGWLSYRLGKREEARALFVSLDARKDAAAYQSSALYWIARADDTARRRAAAVSGYRRLADSHTRDYYGLLAAERLRVLAPGAVTVDTPHSRMDTGARARPIQSSGSPANSGARGAARPSARPKASSPPSLDGPGQSLGRPSRAFCTASRPAASSEHVLAGCEFELIGLFQDAEREYQAAAEPAGDRTILLRLSEFALKKADRGTAISLLKSAVPDYLSIPPRSLPMRYWEVLYPRKEWDRIVEYARGRGLDPFLVCGLILQESGFNPLAVSSAGAVGLMQVLPSTGAEGARATGEVRFSRERLLEPAANLRIGTWHLAAIIARCGGRVDQALAAYNAGEGRLARWRKLFGNEDPASFVEEIPYTETRLYVKHVLSNAAMYRAIYGG